MVTLKGFSCRDELVFGSSAGPRGDQEEVAAVAPAEVHELRRQISAAVYRQQQQLQHPDLHADEVQPQNAPGFVLLPRRPLQHMSPTGGSREHHSPSCKTSEASQKTKDVRLKEISHTPVIYTCTQRLTYQDCKWLRGSLSRTLKHHYFLMIRRTRTGRSLRHYAVVADGVVLVGSGERSWRGNVQSGAITPWLKTTQWIFRGSKWARRRRGHGQLRKWS